MNENIDLTQILKECPKGTKLWSMLDEEVKFDDIDKDEDCINFTVTKTNESTFYYNDGKAYRDRGECVLFPSKEQRDWSKFKAPNKKVKVTLHPFDKVLVRDSKDRPWTPRLFTYLENDSIPYGCMEIYFRYCIPYNKDTAHLLYTKDDCPIDYDIEFSKEFKEK